MGPLGLVKGLPNRRGQQNGGRRGEDHTAELVLARRHAGIFQVVHKAVCTIQPQWYVFAFGKPRPADPTRPMVTLSTSWNNVRKKAKVAGRWHDNRHTLITDLAESGGGDETIRNIAGHVSLRMLRHYSHIRMEAKRTALESIVVKPGRSKTRGTDLVDDGRGAPHVPPGLSTSIVN